jgi:hypothetical protein
VTARRFALAALGALVLAGAATYWAGERTEVVVIRTRDGDGTRYDTKVWVVDHDGAPWVRVANPKRFWFERLSRNPHVELIRGGVAQPVIARVQDRPEARAAIDARFREKYGAVDWWYGVLRRHPIPVRLDPEGAAS